MRFGAVCVLMGVLAVPGMAVAQDGMGSEEPLGDPSMTDPSMQPTQPGSVTPGSDVRTGMPMGQSQQVEIFKNKDNFKVHGTVSSVDAAQNMITVQREGGLPPVQLQVATGTDIKMDGRQASLQQLQPGNEVRAEFNLAQNQPVAISLDAKKSKEQKHMQRDTQRMERDATKMNQ